VEYVSGSISGIGYDSTGAAIAKQTIETTGAAANIILESEYPNNGKIMADNQDVALIKVYVTDAQGRAVPDASNVINFSISGPGVIYGVGNGDPACHEKDKGVSRSLFNGLARAIVKGTTPGTITLTASSTGLKSATIQVTSS